MTIREISKLVHLLRKECQECCGNSSAKRLLRVSSKQRFTKKYVSNTNTTENQSRAWSTFVQRWEWTVPIGVGVSLLAVLQWRHLRKHPYTMRSSDEHETFHDFMITCYCSLPLRITSRIWGWIASIELPVSLRPFLYGFYARAFHANLDEIDLDLSTFPSLVDFFVRPLKRDARPIDPTTNMVSPSDGRILHFGPVTSCRVEQVKGATYNLRHFLGDTKVSPHIQLQRFTEEDDRVYVRSLLKNVENQLYQLIVYLAPGDYHRFHSPADWQIEYRRHFQGKLLSVNPRIARFLPDLFSLNERAIYVGTWKEGFMAYAAVGATNVGSIKVYCDQGLSTNKIKWPEAKHWDEESLGCKKIHKGDLFGEFRMGSTIVLLFEAPVNFEFSVKIGDTIKVGQALTRCSKREKE
ncbi:hypothetical protein KM043_001470 [Ampulex compressa]|nr:hypothetical protein KM043_001470 [Ampulex compressa]